MGIPNPYDFANVENGLGANHAETTSRKKDWGKFAILAVLIAGALWVLASLCCVGHPWQKSSAVLRSFYASTIQGGTYPIYDETFKVIPSRINVNRISSNKPLSSVFHPTSWINDPDPSRTTYCDEPYLPHLPIVQFAIIIDAGSTGSRVHIYKFNNCGPSADYEYEITAKVTPGLSDHANSPGDAAKTLDKLLALAFNSVPETLKSRTPVAVRATAGLRLLGKEQSDAIMKAVEAKLHEWPFQVPATDAAIVMDGREEGIYAWITANYLLKTIRADTPLDTQSYAAIEMGGASTQIVFEPAGGNLEDGDHKYGLRFAGRDHTLYQHSFLGYGQKQARKRVHELVHFTAMHRETLSETEKNGRLIGNPCLAKGVEHVVKIKDETAKNEEPEKQEKQLTVKMAGEDIGSFEACSAVVDLVLAKDVICDLKPCSFDGVYQPSLPEAFPWDKILLFSGFYWGIAPLLPPPQQSGSLSRSVLHVGYIAELARRVCEGETEWKKYWPEDEEVLQKLSGNPEWCLDLTVIYKMLTLGYGLGDKRELTIGSTIDGTELGWSLGAALVMVGESDR